MSGRSLPSFPYGKKFAYNFSFLFSGVCCRCSGNGESALQKPNSNTLVCSCIREKKEQEMKLVGVSYPANKTRIPPVPLCNKLGFDQTR